MSKTNRGRHGRDGAARRRDEQGRRGKGKRDAARNDYFQGRAEAMATTKPLPMNQIAVGGIFDADFPFDVAPRGLGLEETGVESAKLRPVLVVVKAGERVLGMPITTKRTPYSLRFGWQDVESWEDAGLSGPSRIVYRLHWFDRRDLRVKIGELAAAELEPIEQVLADLAEAYLDDREGGWAKGQAIATPLPNPTMLDRLEAAAAARPSSEIVLRQLASVLGAMGETDREMDIRSELASQPDADAIDLRLFATGIERFPSSADHRHRSQQARWRQRAREILRGRAAAGSAEDLTQLGWASLSLGEEEAAERFAAAAHELDPFYPPCDQLRKAIAAERGKDLRTWDDLEQRATPASLAAAKAEELNLWINCFNQLRRFDGVFLKADQGKRELAERLDAAYEALGDAVNAAVCSSAGWLAMSLGRPEAALDRAQRGLLLDPDNSNCKNLEAKMLDRLASP